MTGSLSGKGLQVNIMERDEIISGIYGMPEKSVCTLASHMEKVCHPKGFHVFEAGKVESDVYFLSRGIARAFMQGHDGKDVTFWIGIEGDSLLSLKSYVHGRPGYETIELMEDSELFRVTRKELEELYHEDIWIANWGRKLAESELIRTEERLIPMLFMTATERYTRLLKDNPELLQRIPLECLASYLGITPVSLSRIRARIR